jgi:hypothetical protein
MVYETNLLSLQWWIGSLFGNMYLAMMIIELLVLVGARKMVNITSIAFIIVLINSVFLVYGIFAGTIYSLPAGLMALITVVIAIILAKNF